PRRSPRRAFGGNSGSTPQGGKQTKNKTLRNPQSFSYELSHPRGHAMVGDEVPAPNLPWPLSPLPLCGRNPEPLHAALVLADLDAFRPPNPRPWFPVAV